MIARRGDRSSLAAARLRDALGRPGFGSGARRLAAFLAITLLSCNWALAGEPSVLLLRGWFGVFSTGLDNLADQLRGRGINAEVAGHLHWSTAVSDILRDRAAGKTGPLVLVGHSQGANNVIDIARALEPHNIPVDLVVTLAPFMQDPIPANVVRAVNYYQSAGWGSPIVPDPGFHGTISNIDVADDRTILHISIDKSAKVQAAILQEIAALAAARNATQDVTVSLKPSAAAAQARQSEKKPSARLLAGAGDVRPGQ